MQKSLTNTYQLYRVLLFNIKNMKSTKTNAIISLGATLFFYLLSTGSAHAYTNTLAANNANSNALGSGANGINYPLIIGIGLVIAIVAISIVFFVRREKA